MKFQVQVKPSATDWQDAITLSAAPLLADGSITEEYITAMIENVIENGSYICVADHIALPHARSERGAKKTAVAITKLATPVMFPDEKSVSILICLAAADKNEHSDALALLSEFFIDEDLVEEVLGTSDAAVIQKVFDSLEA